MIGKFYLLLFFIYLFIFKIFVVSTECLKIYFLQMHRSARQSLDCSQSDVLLFLFVAGHSGYFLSHFDVFIRLARKLQLWCSGQCSCSSGEIWEKLKCSASAATNFRKIQVSGFYMKCSGSHSVRLPAMLYVNCKLDKSRAFEEQLHMVGDQVDTMVAALSAVAEDTGISIISYSCFRFLWNLMHFEYRLVNFQTSGC